MGKTKFARSLSEFEKAKKPHAKIKGRNSERWKRGGRKTEEA